jgi:hypothetical protein
MSDDVRSFVRLVDRASAPDLWDDIESRIPRRPPAEPGGGRRVAAAAVAIVVTLAAFAFGYEAFRSDGSSVTGEDPEPSVVTSPIPRLTGEARITAEIPLPEDAVNGGVAVGAGSAWVGLGLQKGNGEQQVIRIDLATNEIMAQIPVTESPSRKRIAATEDAVWVASTGLLERIDPRTNSVVARVRIPERYISAIAVEPAAVWAITVDRSAEGILVRVDPQTNEIVAEIPLGPQIAGYEDEVRLGAGSVWVLGVRWFERENAEYGSDLIRIDPESNAIVARIPVGGFHMVVGTDEVWVRFPADGVFDASSGERWLWTRIHVPTNESSEPFRFEDDGLKLVSPTALWSVGYDEQEYVRVTRFDPDTFDVEARSEPIRSYYHDAVLDPGSGSVWVSTIGNVVRMDIS